MAGSIRGARSRVIQGGGGSPDAAVAGCTRARCGGLQARSPSNGCGRGNAFEGRIAPPSTLYERNKPRVRRPAVTRRHHELPGRQATHGIGEEGQFLRSDLTGPCTGLQRSPAGSRYSRLSLIQPFSKTGPSQPQKRTMRSSSRPMRSSRPLPRRTAALGPERPHAQAALPAAHVDTPDQPVALQQREDVVAVFALLLRHIDLDAIAEAEQAKIRPPQLFCKRHGHKPASFAREAPNIYVKISSVVNDPLPYSFRSDFTL